MKYGLGYLLYLKTRTKDLLLFHVVFLELVVSTHLSLSLSHSPPKEKKYSNI
jgi:hypothetical protein